MRSLCDLDTQSLRDQLADWGCNPKHARRILREFYQGNGDFESLLVGKALTAKLLEAFTSRVSERLTHTTSHDGTTKLLIGFPNGAGGAVESVLMPGYRPDRSAACVSSQIGCAMGCDFCASTRGGLERNLEVAEIVEQFLHLRDAASALGRKITSLVFMGMGEPMNNLDNVIPAIRRIGDPDLGGLGWRQITVSTVGIVPGIDRLAEADLNVHLAVSLHAADDETRSRIVPMNRKYPVAEVLAATRRFFDRTRRIPTIEYCLLDGINDFDDQAELLAEKLGGLRAHINLIPYNSIGLGISGANYQRPSTDRLIRFLTILRDRGFVTHFRDTRGDDVNAACGQLRERLVTVGSR